VLDERVRDRGITIRYETPAKELIQDPSTGAIQGVVATSEMAAQRIRANRAVILATGGYENNVEMQGYYHFPGLTLYPFGTPYNTGDGVKMAAAVGADQWHFVSTEFLGVAIKAPTEACGAAFAFLNTSGSFIFVNRYGRRFINESKRLTHRKDPIEFTFFDHEQATYRNMPSFCVFDEKERAKWPLYTLANTTVGYPSWQGIDEWSRDNSAEIEKGWIVRAGNLEELAETIMVDAAGLSDTVVRYNAQCRGDEPREFGRPADNMEPLEGPPFYAFELCLSIVNTQGGPKHNRLAQTLDTKGEPIPPRLYTPGELGSFFGHLYQGGSNYPEAIAFGRIAGENAAAEIPW
jgi:succinate dehydrogenase/fumarate reductase flavoprotein subunit